MADPKKGVDLSPQLDNITKLAASMRDGILGAREEFVAATRSLLNEVESPTERIWRMLWGEVTHHACVRLGVELKLFDKLADDDNSPKNVDQLASSCSCDPVLMRRILQHLAAMGTVKELDVGVFANTPMSSILTRPEYAMSVRLIEDWVAYTGMKAPEYFTQCNWQNPNDIRDSVFQHAYDAKGQTYFEWGSVNGTPPVTFQFGQMLTAWSRGRRHWMDSGYYPVHDRLITGVKSDPSAVFLVDVGGNNGHDLQQLKEKFPDIPGKLVLQDLPGVIDGVKGVEGVFEPTVHDFFTSQPVKGARGYYLHSILHDWSDADCHRILSNLIPALEKGYSRILLQEMVVPDKGAHWQLTSLDWELMMHFGGAERTEAQWRDLIESTGKAEGRGEGGLLKVTGIYKHALSQDSLIEVELA